MTIAVPLGYRLAGVHCGIKKNPAKPDLALVVSDPPAAAAGAYTQNLVFGAPVGWDRKLTPCGGIRAVVVNSGVSNACTGERGDRDAAEMARLAAATVGGEAKQALVMSTGVIGTFLPLDKIALGVQAAFAALGQDGDSLVAAARGMMTTDTRHKLAGRSLLVRGKSIRVCGMAKGAAMIGPNMATMLCLVLTDAALSPAAAQEMLSGAVDETFNCIAVEGHMSTSDTVLFLANGAASAEQPAGDDLAALRRAVLETCTELAIAIPDDGEGVSHLVTIDVKGCRTRQEARQIAKTVAESALVKTAIAGADPNWGRIVSAAGYAGVPLDAGKISLKLNGFPLYQRGAPVTFDAPAVSQSIRGNRQTSIELWFGEGDAQCRFWTTDLTAEYVRLNADYTT
ncbi:MAG: bifunctional glutamate N-acetyltransferase/amino-acid acetyltransferase ArgJ [Planctomycetia bacterium]|nr:bifunctional glutamate N-acetyltransferase/amino-acid acetyltransferase ArgJ [Planctomycetia bacterium]